MYNPGVAVSAMSDVNLQGMVYAIKRFKRIGRMCTHANFELSKVRAMFHQRDTEETHKDPKVVPSVNPR